MAFCLYRRSDVKFGNDGLPLAGGKAYFYDVDTLDGADVFADSALGTNLGVFETLDSSGRFNTAIWGDQSYRVRFFRVVDGIEVFDSEDEEISDPAGASNALPDPTGHSDEFLTTDGVNWLLAAIRQLPDPSGGAGKIVTTDGDLYLLKTIAELGFPTIVNTTGEKSITFGPFLIQFDDDTFPVPTVTPHHGATKTITFGTAFASAPACFATPAKIDIADSGFRAVIAYEATASSVTFDYNINENTTDPGAEVDVAVPFSWFAIGLAA